MPDPDQADGPSFSDKLLSGETVLWWGQPRQGLVLAPRDGLLIPFSLLWGGFAVFWESTVIRTEAPWFFVLWGVPFVAVGLFFIFGRFLLDAWLRKRLYYAVTDFRVLIARAGPWPSFKAIALNRLPETTLNESRDNRGTIRFGPPVSMWGGGAGRTGFGSLVEALDPTPQFLGIKDAHRVFAIIQERAQAASR